jgi:hypothetical protein
VERTIRWARLLVGLTRHEQGRAFGELRQLPDSREGLERSLPWARRYRMERKRRLSATAQELLIDALAGVEETMVGLERVTE